MVEAARMVKSEVEPSCTPMFMLSSLASVKINLFKIKEKWLPLGLFRIRSSKMYIADLTKEDAVRQ
jgi:hypothetical protein